MRDQQRLFETTDKDFTNQDFAKLVTKTYEEPNDPFPYVKDLLDAYGKYNLK